MLGQECLATDCLSILNFLGLSVFFFSSYFSPAQLGSLLQFHEFFPERFSQNFQLSSCVSVCTLCYRIKLLLPTTIIQTLCWQLCTRTSIDWTVNNLFMKLNKNLRWCLFDWADWFMPPVYALLLWIYVTLMRILKSCLISKFLKVALSQKVLEDFYFFKNSIPNLYPEQKIWIK